MDLELLESACTYFEKYSFASEIYGEAPLYVDVAELACATFDDENIWNIKHCKIFCGKIGRRCKGELHE